MQGSGDSGSDPRGGAAQRPFGKYAELNRAHERIARELASKERTDGKVARFQRADPTHPSDQPRDQPAARPAVVGGNDWVARGRAMAAEIHGRLFGRHPSMAPSPAGSETTVTVATAPHSVGLGPEGLGGQPEQTRDAQKLTPRSPAPGGGLRSPTVGSAEPMRVDTASLWEKSPVLTEAARPADIGQHRTMVDQVYDRIVGRSAQHDNAASPEKSPAQRQTLSASPNPEVKQHMALRAREAVSVRGVKPVEAKEIGGPGFGADGE